MVCMPYAPIFSLYREATAVGAQQGQHLAGAQIEIHVLKSRRATEGFADAPHLYK